MKNKQDVNREPSITKLYRDVSPDMTIGEIKRELRGLARELRQRDGKVNSVTSSMTLNLPAKGDVELVVTGSIEKEKEMIEEMIPEVRGILKPGMVYSNNMCFR